MKHLIKSIGKNERVRKVMRWLGTSYLRLVYATGRWTIVGEEVPARHWDQGKPFILAFWHGRILLIPRAWRRGAPFYMLASQHRDGLLMAGIVEPFGLNHLTGSSTRGGSAAVRLMLRVLKGGHSVGITPDGPRGPRMRAGDGVVNIARLSGVPIIPVSGAITGRKVLGTWDRMIVPLPFSQGVIVWGAPISVPRDADAAMVADIRDRLERDLCALSAEADRRTGHPPV